MSQKESLTEKHRTAKTGAWRRGVGYGDGTWETDGWELSFEIRFDNIQCINYKICRDMLPLFNYLYKLYIVHLTDAYKHHASIAQKAELLRLVMYILYSFNVKVCICT